MGYRTVSLNEEAYSRLKSIKKKGKSFSDVVIELTEQRMKKKSFWDHAGMWQDMSDEEAEMFLKDAREMWQD